MKVAVVALRLAIFVNSFYSFAAVASQQDTDYNCNIHEYASESSPEGKLLKKIPVPDPALTPNVRTGVKDHINSERGRMGISLKRYDGLLSIDVSNARGEILTISSVPDGVPLAVKSPALKLVINCNPPKAGMLTLKDFKDLSFEFNPMSHGGYIFHGVIPSIPGQEIVNPFALGAAILPTRIRALYLRLLNPKTPANEKAKIEAELEDLLIKAAQLSNQEHAKRFQRRAGAK